MRKIKRFDAVNLPFDLIGFLVYWLIKQLHKKVLGYVREKLPKPHKEGPQTVQVSRFQYDLFKAYERYFNNHRKRGR